jgi:glycosyltransferase involved in cell wall biosynthesis
VARSVLVFCGQPLVARPISQRIAAFGAFLADEGWDVRLTAVDPAFDGTPYVSFDPVSGLDVEIVGPTHYRIAPDGRRVLAPALTHLRECRDIAARLRERADETKVDRVLVSTTHPASLMAVAMLRWSQQLWLDIDDWHSAHFVAGGGSPAIGAVYDVVERIAPRAAHHVTVCSNELASLFPSAIVVPNFIRLRDVPRRPRHEDRPPGTRVRVTFPGSITPYYGHVPLLHAIARRRAECAALDVRVIGDGEALDECRDVAVREHLDGIVTFTGRVDRAAMLAELVASDVSVLPLRDLRLDRARFPLKMLDALACGSALAASDTGMVHDTLADGESALLSRPGDMDALLDQVLELASNDDLRVRIAKAGMEVVREFDEDPVCRRWMALLS